MCTGCVVAGKVAEAGIPILMKHRDVPSDVLHHGGNVVHYQDCRKFGRKGILSVVDSSKYTEQGSLCGVNSAGFTIMNTATYNLGIRDSKRQISPSRVMFMALSECESALDFEKLLYSFRGKIMPSNYGVIDNIGQTYFYEVGSEKWSMVDVDVTDAGYVVFTNYSKSGIASKVGLEREMSANYGINQGLKNNSSITPRILIDNISRSFYSPFFDLDLKRIENPLGCYFPDDVFIPSRRTSFTAVFQRNIIWLVLGYPPTAYTVPIIFGRDLPDYATYNENSGTSKLAEMSLALKRRVFDVNTGEGNRYFNIKRIMNDRNTGILQQISQVENWMYSNFFSEMSDVELRSFYDEYYHQIMDSYQALMQTSIEPDRYGGFRICLLDEKFDGQIMRKTSVLRRIKESLF